MKAIWNKVIVIALVAVMVGVLVFSYVSAITNYDFTVFIFAGAADQETNRDLIDTWAEQYAEAHADEIGKSNINVGISFQSDTNLYFSQVQREIASGKADDVFYVSPKYVKSFALNDAVLDLTDYVDWNRYDPNGIWSSAIGAYAFVEEDGTIGAPVTYVGDPGASGHEGSFQTAEGKTAGVYALPKDFSSFGLAYNRNFFTQALRDAYTSTADTGGAIREIDASGNETGDAANIINIGKTVRYYPFNYYKYANYQVAIDAQDPIAKAAESVGGYDVTIMGWPGETYDTGLADDPTTSYDDSIGYVTYTYAEYSAMAWAVGYYANTYDVDTPYAANGSRTVGAARGSHKLLTWLNDRNGNCIETDFVYGNDQYEGTLYLTAWLLGNDVDIISDDYRSVTAPAGEEATSEYGINSDEFKEAYAAFLAFGSDWNANSFYSGSGESSLTIGGWGTFNSGRCIFYGCGTWNMATFNSTVQSTLSVGIMPEPVSEDYSPYARVKGADYTSVTYDEDGSGPVIGSELVDAEGNYTSAWVSFQQPRQDAWAARLDTVGYGVNADVLTRYTGSEAWKVDACADLCAYLTLDPEMQLAMTYSGSQLTSFVDQGESYLYYQDESYQTDEAYNFKNMITPDGNASGTLEVSAAEIEKAGLASTLNPGNASTVTLTSPADSEIGSNQLRDDSQVWTFATAVATTMYNQHTTTSWRNVTEYITNEFPSLVPYLNDYFKDSTMGSVISIAYAFKCLNLIALNYEDRNLQLRMVSGEDGNGALDSCMYTYNSQWIDEFGATKGYSLIAYDATRTPGTYAKVWFDEATNNAMTDSLIINPPNVAAGNVRFFTPSAFCDWIVRRSQALLDNAVAREESIANQD